MAEETEKRAKLFMNGRSQAVRLPVEFRFEGTEVKVSRVGRGVLLEPVTPAKGTADWAGKGGVDFEKARVLSGKLGPADAEFAGMLNEAVRKLKGQG
jgi:virulence-associated protein VagC